MSNHRRLSLPNFRTFFGLPTTTGGYLTGAFMRSSDPRFASDSDLEELTATYRLTTVLDLRGRQEATHLGPSLPWLPVIQAHLDLPDQDAGLTAHLDPRHLSNWLPTLIETAAHTPGTTLIHCQAGWDRTGLVSAYLQTLLGATPHAVASDWARTVDNLPRLAAVLGQDDYILTHLPHGLRRLQEATADPSGYRASLRATARSIVDHVGGRDGARELAISAGADPKALDVLSREAAVTLSRNGRDGHRVH